MIRVLHVVHGMDCGGTENFIMNLYRNIDRSKVQFDFLVHTEKKCFFDDEIKELGGGIFHVPYYRIINLFAYKIALQSFFEEHRNQWTTVHGHLGSCACVYLRVAKKYGLYTIAHSHAINNKNSNIKDFLYRLHACLTRGIADYYMGCSYEAGLDRYGKTIADSDRFKIVNNGIKSVDYIYDSAKRQSIRDSLGINDKYVIGHVGRFNAVKNHKFLVEILSELKKIREDFVLMLVGDGELKKSIIQQAKHLGVLDSIMFLGIRKDIPNVLQGMDQFVFPSFNEGLGISIIEAQAAGLPCIANKDGITSHAKISNLVEMRSISEGAAIWAEYIDKIRNKTTVREDMSETVKKEGFDIVEVANWIENFYLHLVSSTNEV